MIFIAGEHIENIDQLSLDFQQVLSLIGNGHEWLNWALYDPSLTVYYAQSEQDLLTKIQVGLHETKLLKNNFFSLSLDKAIDFDDEDRQPLVNVFHNPKQNKGVANSLMNKYQLVGHQQLEQIPEMLQNFEQSTSPVLNDMLFREKLQVYEFIRQLLPKTKSASNKTNTGPKAELNQEAFAFAMDKATTPAEFVDYVGFYQACAKYQLSSDQNRKGNITDIWHQLRSICFRLIHVPNMGPVPIERPVADDLRAVLTGGDNHVGYRHVAAAMENLVSNVLVMNCSDADIKQSIEQYVSLIQNSIAQAYFQAQPIAQDGWLRSFLCLTDNMKIILQVDPTGDIFLSPQSGLIRKNQLITTE